MSLRAALPALLAALAATSAAQESIPVEPSYVAARGRAASERRDVMILFTHAIHPASEDFRRELLADRKLHELHDRLLLVLADPYDRGEGSALARRFDLHRLPALVVMDGTDAEVDRLEAIAPARDVRRLLDEVLARRGTLSRLRERQRGGDLEATLQLGRELKSRGDVATARSLLERLAAEPPERVASSVAARALYELALCHLKDGNVARAKSALAACRDRAPDSAAAIDAELCAARLAALEGHTSEAVAALERFRRDHPGHPRDSVAKDLLEKLTRPTP